MQVEVIKVPRERVVKYPPKKGKLKRSEIKRAVREVLLRKRGGGTAQRTRNKTTFKVGRDTKTGRFISCQEAERRKETAVVETINRTN